MAIISFAYPILFYWLGKDFADKGWAILIIVAVTYFLLSLFGMLQNFLLGLNKVRFLMSTSIMFATLNIIFMLVLIPKFGIVGAAWAYLAGVIPVPFIFYLTEKNFLQLHDQAKFYVKLYAKLIFTSAAYYLLMHFFINRLVVSFASLVVIGPLAVAAYFLLYYLFGFIEAEDWQLFVSYWGSIKKRLFSS